MVDRIYTVQCQLGNGATITAASPVVSWFETRTVAKFTQAAYTCLRDALLTMRQLR
jgi:hypothetical protein